MEDYRLEQSGQEVQNILNGAAMQTDLKAENERAELAEQTLQGNIDAEASTRENADIELQGHIDDEEIRAKTAEKQNADDIDAIEEKIPSGASSQNKLATAGELAAKQDALTFDNAPTPSSTNPVTSGGVYTAIDNEKGARINADAALQQAIEAILLLIPSAASALNQLADKSFVNSTVATASATFRGTYNLVSDLSLAVTATHAQIAAALAGAVSGADNNDYCFVQIPTSGDTPTEIRVTERYKFNGTTWAYEYDLNNSGFTAAQWEAINSAITSALVTKLSNLPDATQLANLFAGKQNTLTFDDAPVSGSSNPVKSGGIYDAIAAITAVIPSTATSSNKLVDLNALTTYVTGIIGALDASFDLTSADGHVTLKMTQVDGVITTLQILTSDIASAQALTTLSGQVSTNADDIAALQALYNALQQSAPQIIEPTDTWPVASPSATVIYRVIDRVNTPPQYYSDYIFKADDLNTPVLMATYNNAIDAVPTAGSHNLVESGGVQNELALGAVYDVSAKNPTAGPNYDGKFNSLAALLSDANLNTLIPDAYRKGGMSIKFVQSSDNKYVQYRLTKDEWSINASDWIECDSNKVEGKVFYVTDSDGNVIAKIDKDGVHSVDFKIGSNGDSVAEAINGISGQISSAVNAEKLLREQGDTTVTGLVEAEEERAKAVENTKLNYTIIDNKFCITDANGYIICKIDASGVHSVNIDENPNTIADNKLIITDSQGYIIAKVDSEGVHAHNIFEGSFNDNKLIITDNNGYIICKINANGVHSAKDKHAVACMVLSEAYYPTSAPTRDGDGNVTYAEVMFETGVAGSISITYVNGNSSSVAVVYGDYNYTITINRDVDGNVETVSVN